MQHAGLARAEKYQGEAGGVTAACSPLGGWEDTALRGIIVAVAVSLAWYTWGRWGDFQVDCGRELYVPTEILRGKLIYRDIFYPYGPLAPYAGALLIAIFGPHLAVFYFFGIVVAIGCSMLLLELGTMLEGPAVGLTAALAVLLMGFGSGFSNYVFPYSYAATIGLVLSLGCALFVLRHLSVRGTYDLMLAGLAASLALLCKQEFGAACYLLLAFVLVMEASLQRSPRPLLYGIAACGPGVVLWVAIYGWFFWTLTPAFMVDANWISTPGTYSMRTYGQHLYYLHGQVGRQMLLLLLCAAISPRLWFLLAKANERPRIIVLAIIVAVAVACRFGLLVWAARGLTEILVFPEGMFFIGCGFVTCSTYELVRKGDWRHLVEVAFGIFALVLALRVFEGITPSGYSMYFAMPLFLVFVVVISRCIKAATPAFSSERQRKLVNYLLATEIVMLALICIPQRAQHTAVLKTSWGTMILKPDEADVARQILDFISQQKNQGRQVAVVPEAPLLYALAGTEAPSRWFTLLPGLLSPAQEDVYIGDLKRADYDYILVTARKTAEYGADYFGIDYDQKIYHWIESNYRIAGQFGRFRRDDSGSTLAALLYEKDGTGQGDRSR